MIKSKHPLSPALGIVLEGGGGSPSDDLVEQVEVELKKHGVVLLRGFAFDSERFLTFTNAFGGEFMSYSAGAVERKWVASNPTHLEVQPGNTLIPLHGEAHYKGRTPTSVFFFCREFDCEGGATTVASSRSIYNALDPEVRRLFEQKRICYIRTYEFAQWTGLYQTRDLAAVRKICESEQLELRAIGDDEPTIQTRYIVSALVQSGEGPVFINNILPVLGQERILGRRSSVVRFEDGMEIDQSVWEHLLTVAEDHTIDLAWQVGDVVAVDNFRVMHGRRGFSGRRVMEQRLQA